MADRYPQSKTVYQDGVRITLCRGCEKPVPKGRHTWCSNECYKKFEPGHVRARVWKRDKGACRECHADLKQVGISYEYHHVIPVSEGGPTTDENMILLCRPCHVQVTRDWHAERSRKNRDEKRKRLAKKIGQGILF